MQRCPWHLDHLLRAALDVDELSEDLLQKRLWVLQHQRKSIPSPNNNPLPTLKNEYGPIKALFYIWVTIMRGWGGFISDYLGEGV